MFDITKLHEPERYERFKFFPVTDEIKNCTHTFEFYFNSRFPFIRYNKRERYIADLGCGIFKCTKCGHCILKKPYFKD